MRRRSARRVLVEAPAFGACILARRSRSARSRSGARDAAAARRLWAASARSLARRRTPVAARTVPDESDAQSRRGARAIAVEPPGIDAAVAARWLVAFLARRADRAARHHARGRRPLRRRRFGGDGVSVRARARPGERLRDPDAVPDLERRKPGGRAAWSSTRSASTCATIEISAAVDGYLQYEPDADPRRRGNVMARTRMIVLFDQSAKLDALPIGTGNKTERLLGYFTWHADDTPPVNPLGDLFKTQVWALARYLGVPRPLIDKAAERRSRSRSNRRSRSRHHLRSRRRDSRAAVARATRTPS